MDCAFEVLMDKIKKYNKNADDDRELLLKAYTRCKEEHAEQQRHSGEPYFVHPYEVACILADMELDTQAIIAGLLHDVIEDTPYGYEQVKAEFGPQVAMLVEGVSPRKRHILKTSVKCFLLWRRIYVSFLLSLPTGSIICVHLNI